LVQKSRALVGNHERQGPGQKNPNLRTDNRISRGMIKCRVEVGVRGITPKFVRLKPYYTGSRQKTSSEPGVHTKTASQRNKSRDCRKRSQANNAPPGRGKSKTCRGPKRARIEEEQQSAKKRSTAQTGGKKSPKIRKIQEDVWGVGEQNTEKSKRRKKGIQRLKVSKQQIEGLAPGRPKVEPTISRKGKNR